jgi:hypothetical protein
MFLHGVRYSGLSVKFTALPHQVLCLVIGAPYGKVGLIVFVCFEWAGSSGPSSGAGPPR